MIYDIEKTNQFKKDYKLAKKRGSNIEELKLVIGLLADDIELPEKYHDHELKGEYLNYRECHIGADFLLVYKKTEKILLLTLFRLGTHSDLF